MAPSDRRGGEPLERGSEQHREADREDHVTEDGAERAEARRLLEDLAEPLESVARRHLAALRSGAERVHVGHLVEAQRLERALREGHALLRRRRAA